MRIHIAKNHDIYIIRQGGFSLIELMIAITLGLLVLFSVSQMFLASVQSMHLQNAFSRVQENGRISLELISRDIRGADFWGCLHNTSLIVNHLDTTDSDYNASANPSGQQGVTGGNDVTARTIATISVVDNTDTLTLRGARSFSDVKVITPFMATPSADINIVNGAGISKGDVVMISNCQGADLFSDTDAASTILGHNIAPPSAGAVKNVTQAFSQTYTSSAQILVPYVKTYFVGTNIAGSTSLYVSEDGTAKELARGISDLQIMYGEDTDGDNSADTFSTASGVGDMNKVLSIRFELVSKNSNGASSQVEKHYALTANIRNRTLQ
ncbi:PilW family protein [Psychromonas hadalis]|uniref:PilW family protein n=1 Tax=Psychromonas hadalis TaxID=211669 RepID=UPI0003B54347|nr:PilW family protein [Psychromonas hadalis]